jgi:hypothetical protein
MKKPIQLEPQSAFQAAIVKTDKKGFITYNYYKLIDVCMDLYEMSEEDATEWVDYNIVGLAVNGFKVSYAQPRR